MAFIKKQYRTSSLDETLDIAIRFGEELQSGAVVLFYGDLGAGKTTFVKGIASSACKVPPSSVVSPTFSLLNIYKGTKNLFHFDLYRMNGPEDFIAMGFDEYLDPDGITCIEWSEKIEGILPPSCYKVHIEHEGSDSRHITITRTLDAAV